MSTKSWTAHDLRMDNKIQLSKGKNIEGADILTIVRMYRFIDNLGHNVHGLACQRLVRDILWDDIPGNIMDALVKIQNYTRSEALREQNMEN